MKNIHFDPHRSLSIKDKVDALLLKSRAITSCLLAMNEGESSLCKQYWHAALWAVDDYLEELEQCFDQLEFADPCMPSTERPLKDAL